MTCIITEREGASIFVDVPLSSEASLGVDKTEIAIELKVASMEHNPMISQNALSRSHKGGSSHEELESNGSTHPDILSAGFDGGKVVSDKGNSLGDLSSVERVPVDFETVAKQSSFETKAQGSQSLKQAARQSHHQKQYGKRMGTQLEREMPQQKRSRPTASKVVPVKNEKEGLLPASKVVPVNNEKEGLLPAIVVPDETVSSMKTMTSNEFEIEALAKQGVDVVSEPAMLCRAPQKPRARDITKGEAALEFQQCVALLHKYGILNTRAYYLCKSFPSCAPHPGFVGDKHQPKRCKICRVLEDTNNTVICDKCQESFHLSCCLPRLNPKHFDKEDDWYCSSCRKQKRRIGRFGDRGRADVSGDPAGTSHISKVKLGTAYQTNVPLWTGRADDSSTRDLFGMEEPVFEEAKEKERARLLKEFEVKAEKWRTQVANNASNGIQENWLKCNSVLVKAFRDCDGHKHSEIICGKWRRAPSNVQQFERWECFCAIEWDPCHADCAVPQELPTEEILRRMQVKQDFQPSEALKEEP